MTHRSNRRQFCSSPESAPPLLTAGTDRALSAATAAAGAVSARHGVLHLSRVFAGPDAGDDQTTGFEADHVQGLPLEAGRHPAVIARRWRR